LEYIHIGTAYACGYRGGRLSADVSDLSVQFRNPYEESKLRAEIMVREFCAKEKIRLRVFRPSTICGRVIESPHGAVTKFDVFYSWVAWMLRMKKKAGINGDLYVRPFDIPLRIACRSDSGLNIVPADYSAKVVYQVFIQKDPGESYYLVSNEETAHRDYVSWMLKLVNARGTSFVDQPPDEKNNAEAFYYKTVGQIFTPYVTSDPMLFDASSLTTVLARSGLACPQMTQERFLTLMAYARSSDFGLHNK